jgi:hypothetical protein
VFRSDFTKTRVGPGASDALSGVPIVAGLRRLATRKLSNIAHSGVAKHYRTVQAERIACAAITA